MAFHASIRVQENWPFDGQVLSFHVRGQDGKYTQSTHSFAFPQLTPADLLQFLNLRGQMDENAIVRQFRAWVRQRFGIGGAASSWNRAEVCAGGAPTGVAARRSCRDARPPRLHASRA